MNVRELLTANRFVVLRADEDYETLRSCAKELDFQQSQNDDDADNGKKIVINQTCGDNVGDEKKSVIDLTHDDNDDDNTDAIVKDVCCKTREIDNNEVSDENESYYYLHDKVDKLVLSDDARITAALYAELSAESARVFPHANEREFSIKRKFKNLKLSTKSPFINQFQRQYYEFTNNYLGYCPNKKILTYDNDEQRVLLNNLTNFKIIMRLDNVFTHEEIAVTTKVRLFHKKIKNAEYKDSVTCSMAHENVMHPCFDFIKRFDMSKYASKVRNIYAYFLRIVYDGKPYVFRVAFRFDVDWTGVETKNCEIDIECEDCITYKLFLRIGTCILDYFNGQYDRTEEGLVDNFTFDGTSWHDFKIMRRDNEDDDVLRCLEGSVRIVDKKFIKCPEYDERKTRYDDFVNFIAIKNLYDYDDTIKRYIDSCSELLYPLTTMIRYI